MNTVITSYSIHYTKLYEIKLSEVGVIVLMFSAGMEVNIQEIKHCGKSALIIALFGVFLPFV